jgi:hypothetical protein
LVTAAKPSEIDLIPFASFDPDFALWPSNRCADVIFKMNDALALRLYQTGTLNLDDEEINILYQKHIIDSTSGVRVYAFLHALLKKAKRQLRDKMPTPPDIEQATSIGSFGSNLEKYYLQFRTIGVTFDEMTQSRFFLSALQQKGIKIDRFVNRLDNVPEKDPLPEELTLTNFILRIKDIRFLQNSSPAIINYFTRSNPEIVKYLYDDKNNASVKQISERWCLAHNQYSHSAPETVRALRTLVPADWGTQTNAEIIETLYDEEEAICEMYIALSLSLERALSLTVERQSTSYLYNRAQHNISALVPVYSNNLAQISRLFAYSNKKLDDEHVTSSLRQDCRIYHMLVWCNH